MAEGEEDRVRDLGSLVVPAAGALVETGDPWEPYYLSDPGGGRSSRCRSSCGTCRRRAVRRRRSGRTRWHCFAGSGSRGPWMSRGIRRREARPATSAASPARRQARPDEAGAAPVPGKRPATAKYAPSTVAHCETVCRGFYAYHLEAGTGPIVNPFPLARPGRANAHHNPMDPFPRQKAGLFRPRVPRRVPKQIPDSVFNELFARLPSHRDRALVAFWVSTGARASELLSAVCSGADPGQQLITVIRKGSRAVQQLPASPDAFVWLRLYQQEMHGLVPSGPDDPLWWTLRRPFRPLSYHAARAMFDRANAAAGTRWTSTLCVTPRPTASPAIPTCQSATCNGYWSSVARDHADLRRSDGRGRHREHAGSSPPAGGEPKRAPIRSRGRVTGPRAWTCCSGRAAGDRRGVRQGGCPPAQRRGADGDGEVPAPPRLVCLGRDGSRPVRGGAADARSSVPGRWRAGQAAAETDAPEDAALAGTASGDDMAGTLGRHRRRNRRQDGLAGPDACRPPGCRRPQPPGRTAPQRARPGAASADRRRCPAACPALAAVHWLADSHRRGDGPGP